MKLLSDLFFHIFFYYSLLVMSTRMLKLKARFLCHGGLWKIRAGNESIYVIFCFFVRERAGERGRGGEREKFKQVHVQYRSRGRA